MKTLARVIRRSVLAVLVLTAASALYAWWRDRDHLSGKPPEWPPITPSPDTESRTGTTPPSSSASEANGQAETVADAAAVAPAPAVAAPSATPEPAVQSTAEQASASAASSTIVPEPDPAGASAPSSKPSTAAASFVNALVDAPDARSTDGTAGGWVPANDDGSCPLDYSIKANDNSGIFHVPGGRFYDRTKAERCYSNEQAAIADGYRRAKH